MTFFLSIVLSLCAVILQAADVKPKEQDLVSVILSSKQGAADVFPYKRTFLGPLELIENRGPTLTSLAMGKALAYNGLRSVLDAIPTSIVDPHVVLVSASEALFREYFNYQVDESVAEDTSRLAPHEQIAENIGSFLDHFSVDGIVPGRLRRMRNWMPTRIDPLKKSQIDLMFVFQHIHNDTSGGLNRYLQNALITGFKMFDPNLFFHWTQGQRFIATLYNEFTLNDVMHWGKILDSSSFKAVFKHSRSHMHMISNTGPSGSHGEPAALYRALFIYCLTYNVPGYEEINAACLSKIGNNALLLTFHLNSSITTDIETHMIPCFQKLNEIGAISVFGDYENICIMPTKPLPFVKDSIDRYSLFDSVLHTSNQPVDSVPEFNNHFEALQFLFDAVRRRRSTDAVLNKLKDSDAKDIVNFFEVAGAYKSTAVSALICIKLLSKHCPEIERQFAQQVRPLIAEDQLVYHPIGEFVLNYSDLVPEKLKFRLDESSLLHPTPYQYCSLSTENLVDTDGVDVKSIRNFNYRGALEKLQLALMLIKPGLMSDFNQNLKNIGFKMFGERSVKIESSGLMFAFKELSYSVDDISAVDELVQYLNAFMHFCCDVYRKVYRKAQDDDFRIRMAKKESPFFVICLKISFLRSEVTINFNKTT